MGKIRAFGGRKYVFEISFPGNRLDYTDREWAALIHEYLRLLEDQFTDAVVALNLFEAELAGPINSPRVKDQEESSTEEDQLRHSLERNLLDEMGSDAFFQMYPAILHYIALEMRRHRWKSGQLPHEYQRRILGIYAHAFVYALDSFQKVLEQLVKEPAVPPGVDNELQMFKNALPHLKGVRDSAHHLENRGVGRDRNGNPLQLKPINNRIIRAPAGGVLVLNCLMGDRLWYTKADGTLGEMKITRECIEKAGEIFQSVIKAFRWTGRPRLIPSY